MRRASFFACPVHRHTSTHPLARPAVHRFYAETFPPSGSKDAALLDICSSWISHYPAGYSAGRVAGEVMFAPCTWPTRAVGLAVAATVHDASPLGPTTCHPPILPSFRAPPPNPLPLPTHTTTSHTHHRHHPTGLGMNEEELKRNSQLTEYTGKATRGLELWGERRFHGARGLPSAA